MANGVGFCDGEYGCLGSLTISTESLATPAWDIPDLTSLWFSAGRRGDSIVMPGADGRRSNPSRLDEIEVDLLFLVNGEVDRLGTPYSDAWEGLETNLEYLWTNVFVPIDNGRGTRPAVLTLPSAATRNADVRTDPLVLVGDGIDDPTYVEFNLTLTITSGRFAPP